MYARLKEIQIYFLICSFLGFRFVSFVTLTLTSTVSLQTIFLNLLRATCIFYYLFFQRRCRFFFFFYFIYKCFLILIFVKGNGNTVDAFSVVYYLINCFNSTIATVISTTTIVNRYIFFR
jgi:hypothetical protein